MSSACIVPVFREPKAASRRSYNQEPGRPESGLERVDLLMRGILLSVLMLLSGCSQAASQPVVYDSGEFVGGTTLDRKIDWELREAVGAVDGVELVWSSGPASQSAVVPRKGGESMWWAGVTVGVDAPTVVFGGVSAEVDSVVVTVGDTRIDVRLTSVEDGWSVGVAELPRQWAVAASGDQVLLDVVEVVALEDGVETDSTRLEYISG